MSLLNSCVREIAGKKVTLDRREENEDRIKENRNKRNSEKIDETEEKNMTRRIYRRISLQTDILHILS